MPIYEYVCKDDKCNTVTDKLRKLREIDDPLPCKKCEGETQRKISKTSFSLEGGGWAEDGYGG